MWNSIFFKTFYPNVFFHLLSIWSSYSSFFGRVKKTKKEKKKTNNQKRKGKCVKFVETKKTIEKIEMKFEWWPYLIWPIFLKILQYQTNGITKPNKYAKTYRHNNNMSNMSGFYLLAFCFLWWWLVLVWFVFVLSLFIFLFNWMTTITQFIQNEWIESFQFIEYLGKLLL